MRTRTIKKEIIPYIVCAGLFALAGILQYIDKPDFFPADFHLGELGEKPHC